MTHEISPAAGTPGAVVRRTAIGVALIVLGVAEVVVGRAYAERGTLWHFLLHSSIGFGLGLATGALVSAARGRPVPGLPSAVCGQAIAIAPDVAFLLLRYPHQLWMDAFVGHISIHTSPQPLIVGMGVFALGGAGWWVAAGVGRRLTGAVLALLAVGLLAGALAVHQPIPTRLRDYTATYGADPAFWCR